VHRPDQPEVDIAWIARQYERSPRYVSVVARNGTFGPPSGVIGRANIWPRAQVEAGARELGWIPADSAAPRWGTA